MYNVFIFFLVVLKISFFTSDFSNLTDGPTYGFLYTYALCSWLTFLHL